jgi:hypothetical protein
MADLTGMMQAAAGSAGGGLLIQDVFSVDIWTGNGGTQTITNDINLAGEGGLVWVKNRNDTVTHSLVRSDLTYLDSSTNGVNSGPSNLMDSFNSNGFTLGDAALGNFNTYTYVSWTFRKAPKFFDIVTYTGTGANRTVAHNLGAVPGCIMVKRTETSGNWQVYHRANTANPETDFLILNTTAATADSDTRWNDTAPTSTVFTVGTEATVNASGGTYIAYLFAHDDGGFGADENVITCGSFATDGSGNATVTLGYEPQWLMTKPIDATEAWRIYDTTRDWGATDRELLANSSAAEQVANIGAPTSTGFTIVNYTGSKNFIFIACRADM